MGRMVAGWDGDFCWRSGPRTGAIAGTLFEPMREGTGVRDG
jgi:hypothetical protein